jgi:peptide/nickel transport system substrate-binding protein
MLKYLDSPKKGTKGDDMETIRPHCSAPIGHYVPTGALVNAIKRSFFLGVLAVASASSFALAQTLTVGLDVKPKTGDPRLVGSDAHSQYLEELRFLPLFSFDENGKTIPVLAESLVWENPKLIKVKVKLGLKFANGKPITPKDVIANYEFLRNPPANFPPIPRKAILKDVGKIELKGKDEVLFHLTKIDASLPTNLVIPILPEEALKEQPDQLLGKNYESGPFILKSASDQEWVLTRNDSFVPAGLLTLPKVKEVVFKIITDNTTRYSALVKGDLDIVQNSIDADKVALIEKKEAAKLNVSKRLAMATSSLAFNCKDPILGKEKVRQAIGYALKVDDVVKYILQGFGAPAKGMFPPGFEYSVGELKPLMHDLEASKKLLNEAGYPDPDGDGPKPRFSITIKTSVNKERVAISKTIASQLKKVGIEMQVEALEAQTFLSQVAEGKAQVWVNNWIGMKDPNHLHFVFHSSQFPPEGGNRGFFKDEEVDTLLEKGKLEVDGAKRREFYDKAQKILAAKSPYLHLWHRENYVVHKKNVTGFKMFSDGRYVSLTEVEKR